MSAGKLDITIEQGATFQRTINLKNPDGTARNITGSTIAGKLRKNYPDSDSKAFTLSITNAVGGVISWSLSATDTASVSAVSSVNYVYDIELTTGSVVERVLQGKAFISPEATR